MNTSACQQTLTPAEVAPRGKMETEGTPPTASLEPPTGLGPDQVTGYPQPYSRSPSQP